MSVAPTPRPHPPPLEMAPTVAIPGSGALTIGRDPASDLVIDHPLVSFRHARIERRGGVYELRDLGSTNGTYVDGRRVERARLAPGTSFSIAATTLYLNEVGELRRFDAARSIHLEVERVRIDKGSPRSPFTLLKDVSLTVQPGELVGIMGPSGAGKTTLLEALNGYDPPTAGRVLMNGRDLYRHYDQFRLAIGYVPQDDILHPQLTVRGALFYSARLRLPPDTRSTEIEARIECLLEQLGIAEIADRRIGSPAEKDKVLSGGQRKRVNLAMELLTEPWLLFLDEPTSGLSSADALQVLQVLRRLADEGRTVLLSIHQPSLEVFRQMTHLLMLAKDQGEPTPARLAYFGPAYPDALRFFKPDLRIVDSGAPPVTPEVIFDGLRERRAEEWAARYRTQSGERPRPTPPPAAEPVAAPRQPGLYQWTTLALRQLALKRRDLAHTLILLGQAPLIGLLIVMVFGAEVGQPIGDENFLDHSRASATTLFLMAVATLWFGCSNAAREIVAERAIYHRERMVNLKIPSYLGAKLAVLGLLGLVQCATLLAVVHGGCELRGAWPPMFALLCLTALAGTGLGLVLSALSSTSEVAISLVPLVLLPMVILGGIMQPVHEIGPPGDLLAEAMASRWSFEGLLLVENRARPTLLKPPETADAEPETVDLATVYFPSDRRHSPRVTAAVLAAMFAALVLSIALILRSRDR